MSPSSVESKRSSESSRPDPAGGAAADLPLPAGDGFVARLERAVGPYAQRFADAPAVMALRDALPIAFGVVVLYLVALLFVQRFTGWAALATQIRDGIGPAFAVASIVMVVVLALRLAVRLKYAEAPMVGIAFIVFWIEMPRDAVRALLFFALSHGKSGWGAFATTLGASGLFTAIVVCLLTAGAIGLGRGRFGPYKGDIAGGFLLYVVAGVLYVVHFSLAGVIASAVAPLATLGDSFVALAVITAIEAMLWVVGIHGPALLAAVVLPVYMSLQFQNTSAHAHHDPIPHVVVVSTFLFVFPGGAGATLPLVLMLLRSRVPRLRKFAYATILPSLANINEPVIFGLPLAYNPVLAVPFVVAPVVLSCTTYAAMAFGLVTKPLFYVPSTLPIFFNVFLATLDWRACILIALNLALAAVIWLPFVRVYERAEAARAV
jgi:cellobiose-specific phosphotransferase system component IIC